jgi:glycosyltransferase involved in cell wall biosynthesis
MATMVLEAAGALTDIDSQRIATEVYPKLSVIMPAYNEEDQIAQCISHARDHLDRLGFPYEIIVVDDGSTDRTREEALRARGNPHVKVVGYERNQGKGAAVRFGSECAKGDVVLFMDSDADVRPDHVQRYVKALKDADIAIASKWHPESDVTTPVPRRFLSYAFHILVMLLTGVRVSDTQAGLKAFRLDALRTIMRLVSVKHYAFDVEVLAVASMLKMRIVELPVKIQLASLFSARHVLRMLIDLLGITYRLRVIRWYQRNLRNPNPQYKPIVKW